MTRFVYHVSHEQFSPDKLLHYVKYAEKCGFDECASSDHLFPWNRNQGESGFAWSWIGAALEATQFPCGIMTAPVDRYHPVVIAQAAATLAIMYPGRFWVAAGSGEYLNEHITGNPWPKERSVRNARLTEAATIMRELWQGKRVTHHGLVIAEDAQVYSLPKEPLRIIGAAIGEETAEAIASWADGLYTIARPIDELKKVIEAFRRSGGEGKPIYLKVQVACAPSEDEVVTDAHRQWYTNIKTGDDHAHMKLPEDFEELAKDMSLEEVYSVVYISFNPKQHAAWLRAYMELGIEKLVIHNVGTHQEYFIEFYGKQVLPLLRY